MCVPSPVPSPNPAMSEKPVKKRNVVSRARTGCLTCRRRRLKCDEAKPACYSVIDPFLLLSPLLTQPAVYALEPEVRRLRAANLLQRPDGPGRRTGDWQGGQETKTLGYYQGKGWRIQCAPASGCRCHGKQPEHQSSSASRPGRASSQPPSTVKPSICGCALHSAG